MSVVRITESQPANDYRALWLEAEQRAKREADAAAFLLGELAAVQKQRHDLRRALHRARKSRDRWYRDYMALRWQVGKQAKRGEG